MYIPKRYGEGRIDRCPFCQEQATTTNSQDIPVCPKHQKSVLNEMKCACGSYLELRTGKFGPYFHCMNCGNVNMRKVLELNEVRDENALPTLAEPRAKQDRETVEVVRSDDPRYFD